MAIRGIIGETLRTSINHFDASGNAILGATFTVLTANRPDDTVFPVSFREIGGGTYEASVVTTVYDVTGEWFLLVQADNGFRYEETFDIIGYPLSQEIVPAPVYPQLGPSRSELRRAVAESLGDLTTVTATATGTEAMIVDNVNLAQEVNAFKGMQVICISSASAQNVGHIGTVMSNNPTNRSIMIEPPLPALSVPGDTYEMYNYRGNGWKVDQYNRAINQAIARAGDEHAPLPYDVTIDHDAEYLSIPAEFSHFSGVQAIDRYGKRKEVPAKNLHLSRGTREFSLSGNYSYSGRGYSTLRIIGSRRPDQLLSDDMRTHIPFDWVVHEAAAILLQHDVSMGITQGERDRMLAMERQGADGRRSMVIRSFPPGTVKLPS